MEIRLARHGKHIAIVTIDNQPRLNAMTRTMLTELGRLWDELERDGSCRAIVLTGAGTRAFTVGADIAGDLAAGPEIARMVNHALLKTDAYAKPDYRGGQWRLRRRRARTDAGERYPRRGARSSLRAHRG
jgi:enoyl-CoA hydratase/carnithine racemase